jgi:TRAP transporter TAXI family solute receptor
MPGLCNAGHAKVAGVTRSLRYTLVSLREMLVSAGPLVFITIGLLVAAYVWLQPNPPKRVVLATGPDNGAYARFGQAYAQALARHGITVELRNSDGAADNLLLLSEGGADLGFVQGGSGALGPEAQDNLVSLGSLFVEPLWLFYREDSARRLKGGPPTALTDLKGWRVNVGTPGSGVPQLFRRLLEANRLSPADLHLQQLEQTPGTMAFLAGKVDAVVFASAPEAMMVQMLLQTPGVRLLPFAQSQAYARRLGFLTPVTLPQGVVDLAKNLPAKDVPLVASTTSLLARADTHPALLQLMAQAAVELHSPPGWFNRAREYPSVEHGEVPLAPEAERAIRSGPPLLQRYLPFWLANLIERMWLSLGLILALALPLSRVIPPLYTFRIRRRVFVWYAELRDIEERAERAPAQAQALVDELDALEQRAEKITLPLAYTDELYTLRQHIHVVRKKLLRHAPDPTEPSNEPR